MRKIGEIADNSAAERFADFLRGEGIVCSLDQTDAGWAVWIQDEDRLDAARKSLQEFQAAPDDARFAAGARKGRDVLRQKFQERKSARRRVVQVRETWSQPSADRCPLTFGLIAASVLAFAFTYLSKDQEILQRLLISPDGSWNLILHGEVWRLVTPIVIHFGWMHILFNLLWLKDFGLQLESRLGTPRFLGLVLVIAVTSNVAQFWTSGPFFGGMSGVNYGLFGYLWLRSRFEPESGFYISPNAVIMLGVWFLICFTGAVGGVANTAHAVGLAAGCSLAFAGYLIRGGARR